jgi:hypothetical protein
MIPKRRLLITIALAFLPAVTMGQPGGNVKKAVTVSGLTATRELATAVSRSLRQPRFIVTIDVEIQNKQVKSIFEYRAPNMYHMLETHSDGLVKEAIEIAGRRYQKKDQQWIKVRKDPYPLREQVENHFPIKFTSKKDDLIKIKKAGAAFVGEEIIDGKTYRKYEYSIAFRGLDTLDTGIAWVNTSNGLLEKLFNNNRGIFGPVESRWSYDYRAEVIIVPPEKFIERDWID